MDDHKPGKNSATAAKARAKVNAEDQARVQTTDLSFNINLDMTVKVNGLGEVVSLHVKKAGVNPYAEQDETIKKMIVENKEQFLYHSCEQVVDAFNELAKRKAVAKTAEKLADVDGMIVDPSTGNVFKIQ